MRSPETFREGEVVCIKTGAFAAFTGVIKAIDKVELLLKVGVTIFGRAEPIQLRYSDVEKIKFIDEE